MKFFNNYKIAALITLFFVGTIGAQNNEAQEVKSRLKADISFLASDELAGRQTGSQGELASAEYIRKEFKKNKLKLLGKEGFQEFSIIQMRIASSKCRMAIIPQSNDGTTKEFQLFEEYYPLSLSCNNDSVTAETIDIGYGIVCEKEKKDDYIGQNVTGKIVIMRLGYFAQNEYPNSPLAEYSDITTKVKEAEKHGAVGVIFLKANTNDENPSGQLSRTITPAKMPVFFFKAKPSFPVGLSVTLTSYLFAPTAVGHNVIGFKNNFRK